MRKSRRFRKRPEIKGNKKDREWDLIVIVDTSGSMSDEEIVNGLVEINEVCKVTNGSINLLQVDTECSELESYNPNKKTFNRKHCGGTYIAAGVKYLFDNNIKSDALIVISDMEIENIPSDRYWTKYKKPVIFLTTTGLKPDICKNHQIFNIKDA
jgi:predicted metal-dependent peptidase